MAQFKRPTTTDLITNGKYSNAATNTIIETLGFTTKGDGGGALWKKTGNTITASQTPAQTGDATCSDALGNEFRLIKGECGVNFNSLGVLESGTAANNALAFNAAIVGAGSSPIVGRAGRYLVDDTLNFTVDGAGIVGVGGWVEIRNTDLTKTTIFVEPSNADTGGLISDVILNNVFLSRSTGSVLQKALHIRSAAEITLDNFKSEDSHFGIYVEGIRRSNWSKVTLLAGNISYSANSSLLFFDSYRFGGSVQQPVYTTTISTLNIVGSNLVDDCLEVRTCDGLTVDGSYMTLGEKSEVHLNAANTNEIITGLSVNDAYLDANSQTTGSDHAVRVSALASGAAISTIKFNDDFMANAKLDIISMLGAVTDFQLNGTTLANSIGAGIKSAVAGSDINISGGEIRNTGNDSSSYGLDITNANTLNASGVTFRDNFADLNYSNISNLSLVGMPTNSGYIPDNFGNQGTFTPTVEFGGGSTGITYSVQTGSFQQVGGWVFFDIEVRLTSKGSSTGSATIAGLSSIGSAASAASFPVFFNSMTAGVGADSIQARILSGGNEISLASVSGNSTNLTDVEFTNNSQVFISGVYRV